jgi:hypothetical protein
MSVAFMGGIFTASTGGRSDSEDREQSYGVGRIT